MKRKNKSPIGSILETGVTNLVGVPLIGATATAVNELPAGTAKTIVSITPGLQSVSLLGTNLKSLKKSKNFW